MQFDGVATQVTNAQMYTCSLLVYYSKKQCIIFCSLFSIPIVIAIDRYLCGFREPCSLDGIDRLQEAIAQTGNTHLHIEGMKYIRICYHIGSNINTKSISHSRGRFIVYSPNTSLALMPMSRQYVSNRMKKAQTNKQMPPQFVSVCILLYLFIGHTHSPYSSWTCVSAICRIGKKTESRENRIFLYSLPRMRWLCGRQMPWYSSHVHILMNWPPHYTRPFAL